MKALLLLVAVLTAPVQPAAGWTAAWLRGSHEVARFTGVESATATYVAYPTSEPPRNSHYDYVKAEERFSRQLTFALVERVGDVSREEVANGGAGGARDILVDTNILSKAIAGDSAYANFISAHGGRLVADTRVAAELVMGGMSRAQVRSTLRAMDVALVRRGAHSVGEGIAQQLGRSIRGGHRSDMLIMGTARANGLKIASGDVSMVAGAARAGLDARLVRFGVDSGGAATKLVEALLSYRLNRPQYFYWFNPF